MGTIIEAIPKETVEVFQLTRKCLRRSWDVLAQPLTHSWEGLTDTEIHKKLMGQYGFEHGGKVPTAAFGAPGLQIAAASLIPSLIQARLSAERNVTARQCWKPEPGIIPPEECGTFLTQLEREKVMTYFGINGKLNTLFMSADFVHSQAVVSYAALTFGFSMYMSPIVCTLPSLLEAISQNSYDGSYEKVLFSLRTNPLLIVTDFLGRHHKHYRNSGSVGEFFQERVKLRKSTLFVGDFSQLLFLGRKKGGSGVVSLTQDDLVNYFTDSTGVQELGLSQYVAGSLTKKVSSFSLHNDL